MEAIIEDEVTQRFVAEELKVAITTTFLYPF
jgi:Trp operon repressor